MVISIFKMQNQVIPAGIFGYLIPYLLLSRAYETYRGYKIRQARDNGTIFQQEDALFVFIGLVVKCETIGQKIKEINFHVRMRQQVYSPQLTDLHIWQLKQIHWPHVECASFCDSQLGPQSVKIISTFKWKSLTQMKLNDNSFGDEGILYLRLAQWPSLQILQLQSNYIENRGFLQLTRNKTWPRLIRIDFGMNWLNNCNLENLSDSIWTNLQSVDLSFNNISRRGVKELVRCPFTDLRQIELEECQIDDEGLRQLSKGRWELQKICISSNNVTDRGMRFLSFGNWPRIKYVGWTFITQEGTNDPMNTLKCLACSNWSASSPSLRTSQTYRSKNIITNDTLSQRFD